MRTSPPFQQLALTHQRKLLKTLDEHVLPAQKTFAAQNGIVVYLGLLTHRHLIAAAWALGDTLSADGDNRRAVGELQRRRTLIPYVDAEFRLNPSLGRHLDAVSDRVRLYAVGADFGSGIERLVQLVDDYEKAADEGRTEYAERCSADFDYGIFERTCAPISRAPVRRARVAVKSLPGRPLYLAGEALRLPPRCHVEVDGPRTVAQLAHDTVLLIENWEVFDALDALRLDLGAAGPEPLVVWRGGAEGCRTDHALALLAALGRPVRACVDYDPAGLLIAPRLPHLAGVIAPPAAELAERLRGGLRERYLEQLPQCAAVLDAATQPEVVQLWQSIRSAGRALPQEAFLEAADAGQTGADPACPAGRRL